MFYVIYSCDGKADFYFISWQFINRMEMKFLFFTKWQNQHNFTMSESREQKYDCRYNLQISLVSRVDAG